MSRRPRRRKMRAATRSAPQQEGMHLSLPRNGFSITLGGLVALAAIVGSIFTAYNWIQSTLLTTTTTLTTHSTQIDKLSAKVDTTQKEITDGTLATQQKLSEITTQSAIAANNQKGMTD